MNQVKYKKNIFNWAAKMNVFQRSNCYTLNGKSVGIPLKSEAVRSVFNYVTSVLKGLGLSTNNSDVLGLKPFSAFTYCKFHSLAFF